MTVPDTGVPVSHVFVVALEYQGTDITAATGEQSRTALREHAYDLGTAALANHEPSTGGPPRVAFPSERRGWNTTPHYARCPPCEDAVLAIVCASIRRALSRPPQ